MTAIREKYSIGGVQNDGVGFQSDTGYRIIVSKFKDTDRLALLVGFKDDMKLISYHNKLEEQKELLLHGAKQYLSINDYRLVSKLI